MMKTGAVVLAAMLAAATLTIESQPAQAHRSGAPFAAALIGGIALGAILASRHRRHHGYYHHRHHHYGYRPVYYASYGPRWHHRHHRYRHW